MVEDGLMDLFQTIAKAIVRTIRLLNFGAVCHKKTNQGKKTLTVAVFILHPTVVSSEDARRHPQRHLPLQKTQIYPSAWREISIVTVTTTTRPSHPHQREEGHHHSLFLPATAAAATSTTRMDQQVRTVLLLPTTAAATMDHPLQKDPMLVIW